MNQITLTEPIERPITKLIGFNLRLTDLILGTSVKIGITLNFLTGYTPSSEYKEILLEGDDYLAWGNDDTYISDFVKSQLTSLLAGVEPLETISPPIV
jgi:hypothetical protein